MAAIRSAFVSYPKEGDPDWRSPNWIMPEECAHLTRVGSKGLSDREEATCHPVLKLIPACRPKNEHLLMLWRLSSLSRGPAKDRLDQCFASDFRLQTKTAFD